ncbi:MAG: phage late control D family protein, partial [Anaerolineales bacterium]|nr:phage late control D family protein [Anaerolineales bacterium]
MANNVVQLSSQLYLKLDGRWQGPEIMDNLSEVVVDQHCHLPNMFTLRFFDQEATLIEGNRFSLQQEVELGAYGNGSQALVLMKGTITAVEPNFSADGSAEFVVRGYDQSFQLYRERHSKTYVNMRDSDIATAVANEAGLTPRVEQTPLIYEHLYQHNQSDLSFLRERAWRIGYLCFVRDDTLHFVSSRRLGPPELTLTWGENGLEIRPRLNTAERVDEVLV